MPVRELGIKRCAGRGCALPTDEVLVLSRRLGRGKRATGYKVVVDRGDLGQEAAVHRDAVEHDLMERQVQPLLVVGHQDQEEPQERSGLEVERSSRVFGREADGFPLTGRRVQVVQVDDGEFHRRWIVDDRDGPAADFMECRPPRLVSPDDLGQGLPESLDVKLAAVGERQRFVVDRWVRAQLRVEPDLFLSERQRML